MEKTIKVDEKTYGLINELVGELRMEKKRPVSINEALANVLQEKKKKKGSIMDFAGAWKMSDREAEELKKDIKGHRRSWKIRY